MFGSRRAFHRDKCETPIRYEEVEERIFRDSKILNFSRGGLCFEADRYLGVRSIVNINVVDPTPGAFGPEGYYAYLGEVRWCGQLSSNGKTFIGIGVQFMMKSREIPNKHLRPGKFSCNLCGDLTMTRHVQEVLSYVYLCPYCSRHFNSLPDGKIKFSIERFLVGNVL
jgi:hypothetical protein